MTQEDERSISLQLSQLQDAHALLDARITSLRGDHAELRTGQQAMAVELKANTVITAEIRDYMVAGRIGTKVIKWIAGMVLAATAIWGGVKALIHLTP